MAFLNYLLSLLPGNLIDFQPFYDLRESDPKTILLTLGKAFLNRRIGLTVVCLVVSVYLIGYQSIVVSSMNSLKVRDDALKQQSEAIKHKQDQQRQFDAWRNEVTNVSTKIVRLKPEQSSKVISLKESEKVFSIARTGNPVLSDPNNTLEAVSLTPIGESAINLGEGGVVAAPGSSPPTSAAPSAQGALGDGVGENQQPVTIALDKYDYKLSVTGTYPAVVDLVNRLVLLDDLLAISDITIERASNDPATFPDPEKFPDYPVKVTLTLNFSIYLYVPTGTESSS